MSCGGGGGTDSFDLFAFKNSNGDWGYLNSEGEIVINNQFEEANPFYDGRARVVIENSDGKDVYVFIDTNGEYDYSKGGCQLCIHDWFCFPCGIPMCKCSTLRYILSCKCCKDQQPQEEKRNYNRNLFNHIDLPEIIGRINPTSIASEDGENDNAYRIYESV